MPNLKLSAKTDRLKDNALRLTTIGGLSAFGLWSGYKYRNEIKRSKPAKLTLAVGGSALAIYTGAALLTPGTGINPPHNGTPQ